MTSGAAGSRWPPPSAPGASRSKATFPKCCSSCSSSCRRSRTTPDWPLAPGSSDRTTASAPRYLLHFHSRESHMTTTLTFRPAPTLSDLRALDETGVPSLFTLPPEVIELRDSIREFAHNGLRPRVAELDAAPHDDFDWDIVRKGHEIGLLRLVI